MAYWLEIHCDVLKEGRNPNDPTRPLCRSHENENFSGWVRSINGLDSQAKRQGWKRFPDGKWSCPACIRASSIQQKQ